MDGAWTRRRGVRGRVRNHSASVRGGESLRRAPETLLVDLSEVAFLAMAGLSALVELDDRCRASGTSLRLVTSRSLRRIMELTGLEVAFTLYGSQADAFSELAIS